MTKFIFVFEEKEERVEGVRKGESEFNLKLAGFVWLKFRFFVIFFFF